MAGNGKNGVPLIYMQDITRRFGLIAALRDVTFTVDSGEIVGLLGDNGAGKSTLIKVLTGIHPPSEGQIYFEGKPVAINSPKVARALGIETVYQDLALVNLMSIARNFFLGRELVRNMGIVQMLEKDEMNHRTVTALADIGIEIRRPEEEVLRMSGGERQSIAIGRAAHFGQKLLILDEPTSALSVGETRKVLNYTLEAKHQGMGVIFITHNINHVYQVADRFTIISHGHKVGDFLKSEVSAEEISNMIMGNPIPERLQPVVAQREQELQHLHDHMQTTAAPITVAARRRTQQRTLIGVLAVVAVVILAAIGLVSRGLLEEPVPVPTATVAPTVDVATVPDNIKALWDQLLTDPDPSRRAVAASMLGAPKNLNPASFDALAQALQDTAWEVRAAACKTLGKLGDRRAIDLLQPLLRDNNSVVRDAAGEALQVGFGLSCSDAEGCK